MQGFSFCFLIEILLRKRSLKSRFKLFRTRINAIKKPRNARLFYCISEN